MPLEWEGQDRRVQWTTVSLLVTEVAELRPKFGSNKFLPRRAEIAPFPCSNHRRRHCMLDGSNMKISIFRYSEPPLTWLNTEQRIGFKYRMLATTILIYPHLIMAPDICLMHCQYHHLTSIASISNGLLGAQGASSYPISGLTSSNSAGGRHSIP